MKHLNVAVLFLVVFIVKECCSKENEDAEEPKEKFENVLKNITRVNTVLQRLIDNYESLKVIQESSSSDYSSDMESKEIPKQNKTPEKSTTKSYLAATMLFDDEYTVTQDKVNQIKYQPSKNRAIKKDTNNEKRSFAKHKLNNHPSDSSNDSDDSPQSAEESIDIEIDLAKMKHKQTTKPNKTKTHDKNNPERHKLVKSIIEGFLKSHDNNNSNEDPKDARTKDVNLMSEDDDGDDDDDDDDIHLKENLKTVVLRKAYGDACLRVVVRKCFKACKSARKGVCREYKCKSEFKETFEKNSKIGCAKEFGYDQDENSNAGRSITPIPAASDMTRGGYLSAMCSPEQISPKPQPKELSKLTLRSHLPPTPSTNTFNILRDRFEKECKKITVKKCNDACQYALGEACKNEKCIKSKEKKLKTLCKSQCKSSFKLDDSDSSDSSSSSSGSSESKSESKSDSKSHKSHNKSG